MEQSMEDAIEAVKQAFDNYGLFYTVNIDTRSFQVASYPNLPESHPLRSMQSIFIKCHISVREPHHVCGEIIVKRKQYLEPTWQWEESQKIFQNFTLNVIKDGVFVFDEWMKAVEEKFKAFDQKIKDTIAIQERKRRMESYGGTCKPAKTIDAMCAQCLEDGL